MSRISLSACFLGLMLTLSASAFEPREFDNDEQAQAYRQLIQELRCLVCQGQSISDSNAPLAQDMRNLVYRQLRQGKSQEDVRAYMTSRYGDTITLRPPVQQNTALLWGTPPLLLLVGGLVLWQAVRRRRPDATDTTTDESNP